MKKLDIETKERLREQNNRFPLKQRFQLIQGIRLAENVDQSAWLSKERSKSSDDEE